MSGVGPAGSAYYRPAEVARILQCSEWWVKEQARRRRIPFCWIGGRYLFTQEHIVAIVRLFEVRPDQEPRSLLGVSGPSCPSASDRDATGRLRARAPRRVLNGGSKTAAA
jgi:Helix-turn-helix domain